MRDAHRMKEKFDVTLDNRQIVSLLIASIVVLGAVFVLGVVVGKNLAGNAQAAAAPDLLSALDANAQALQEVRNEPPLTFQDELTRKASNEPPPPEPKKVTVALAPPKPAEEPAARPAPSEEASKGASKETTEAPQELLAQAAPPAPSAAAPGKVEPTPVPTRTAGREGGSLQDAFARATRQPTEAEPGGAFTLQLSAFQSRTEAERFAARLRDRGYAPYIVSAEVPGKGTWHRVRMGSFPSKEAAARYLTDFKRETRLDAFVAGP